MKKLIFTLGVISLMVASACNSNSGSQKDNKQADPTTAIADSVTLNGIPLSKAKAMIDTFRTYNISSHSYSSVSFRRSFLELALNIIKTNGGDGIRIYFAKNSAKENAILIVWTSDGGPDPDPKHQGKKRHIDHLNVESEVPMAKIGEVAENSVTPFGLYAFTPVTLPSVVKCNSNTSISMVDAFDMATEFVMSAKNKMKMETKAVWFATAVIQDLLDNIIEGNKTGVVPKLDGIRVYFTKYPGTAENRDTFVLITTGNGVDDYNCYTSNFKSSVDNHGEQCPIYCGVTGDLLPD